MHGAWQKEKQNEIMNDAQQINENSDNFYLMFLKLAEIL